MPIRYFCDNCQIEIKDAGKINKIVKVFQQRDLLFNPNNLQQQKQDTIRQEEKLLCEPCCNKVWGQIGVN